MSKIDDLIKELCPDGARFARVGDKAVIGTGRSDKKDAVENGQYPFYVRSKIVARIDKYSFDEEAIIIPGEGGVGDIFHYANGKYDLHQRAYRIVFITNEVNTKYALYYFMSHFKSFITLKAVNATVTSIRKPMIEDFRIPIPPLEVQKEIVRVLDSFTKLEAELEAELEARKKQYEYYRNTLLTFEDDVMWKPMGEICIFSKDRIASDELTADNYVGVDNLLKDKKGRTISSYVPESGIWTKFVSGDILIGNIRPYLRKIWLADIEGGTNGDVLVFHISKEYTERITPKFLFHCLSSERFFMFMDSTSKGAKMPRGDKKAILNFMIPIPSLSVQKQIVSILDKFEKLTNDISVGLPAEIEARRKQYEYYRNKLLTFKELECSK